MLHAALANVANPKQLPELSQLLLASRQQSEGHSVGSAATMTHILSQQQPAELESWLNAADVVRGRARTARILPLPACSIHLLACAAGVPERGRALFGSAGEQRAEISTAALLAGTGEIYCWRS